MMLMQSDIITVLLIAIVIGLLAYLIKSSLDYSKERKEIMEKENMPMKIITVASCQQNDYTMEREFREGDFIGKIDGTCPKCGSQMIITKIYSLYIETPQKSFKLQLR
jgi:hypothetical protein